MGPADYYKLTDWQICHIIFAERDDDHALVPIKRRIAKLYFKASVPPEVWTKPPPSLEEMRVPPEALALKPELMSPGYVSMFWQSSLSQGLSQEAILEKWQAFAAQGFNSQEILHEWPSGM